MLPSADNLLSMLQKYNQMNTQYVELIFLLRIPKYDILKYKFDNAVFLDVNLFVCGYNV